MIFTFYSLLILSASWSASANPFDYFYRDYCASISEFSSDPYTTPKTLSLESNCFYMPQAHSTTYRTIKFNGNSSDCTELWVWKWDANVDKCRSLTDSTANESHRAETGQCYRLYDYKYYELRGCPSNVTFEFTTEDPRFEEEPPSWITPLPSYSNPYSYSYSATRSPSPTTSYLTYYPIASARGERERQERQERERKVAIGAGIGGTMGMVLILFCIFSRRAAETKKRNEAKAARTVPSPLVVAAPSSDRDARDEIRHAERLARLNGFYAPGTTGERGNRRGFSPGPGVVRADEDPRASQGSLPTYDEAMREHDEGVRQGRRSVTIPLPAYVVDNDGEYRPVDGRDVGRAV